MTTSELNLEDYMLPPLQQNVYKSAAILDAIEASFSRESAQNKDFLHREYKSELAIEASYEHASPTVSLNNNYNSFSSPMEHSLSRRGEAKALAGNCRNKPKKNPMAKGLRSFGKRLRSIFI